MRDPVICADGTTYERREIEAWLLDHDTSPKTDNVLANKTLIPNLALKTGIEIFLAGNPVKESKRGREEDTSSPAKRMKGEIKLMVRNLEGVVHTVYIDPSHSVGALKRKLHALGDKVPEDQRIIHDGKQLNDSELLSEHNVSVDGVVLHLVYRLGGC